MSVGQEFSSCLAGSSGSGSSRRLHSSRGLTGAGGLLPGSLTWLWAESLRSPHKDLSVALLVTRQLASSRGRDGRASAAMWQLESLVWLTLSSDALSLLLCPLGHAAHPWYRVGGAHEGVDTRRQGSRGHLGGLLPQESFHKCFWVCLHGLMLNSFLKLRCNCFTVVCSCHTTKGISHMCTYTPPPSWIFFPPPSIPPLQVIAEHGAELPVLWQLPTGCFTHGSCIDVRARLPVHSIPSSRPPHVHTSLPYICVSAPALQIGSSHEGVYLIDWLLDLLD